MVTAKTPLRDCKEGSGTKRAVLDVSEVGGEKGSKDVCDRSPVEGQHE